MGLDKELSQLMDCPLPTKESQEMVNITSKLQTLEESRCLMLFGP